VSPLLQSTIQDSVTVIELTMMVGEMKKLIVGIALSLIGAVAHAQPDLILMQGIVPATKCGDYLEYRMPNSPQRTRLNDLVIQWTWGFQAAYNWYSGERQIKEGLEKNTVLAYLDKECRDNPQTNIMSHISKLVKQLGAAPQVSK
jgi:hypothetical protein